MIDHADPRALEEHLFAGAELPGPVRRHLTDGCPRCSYQARKLLVGRRDSATTAFGAALRLPAPSTAAVEAVVSGVQAWVVLLRLEHAAAPELFSGLLAAPRDRIEEIRQAPIYHSLGFAEFLAAQSRETVSQDPFRAVELAELSVEVADTLAGAGYAPALAEDARALAWRTLGNARRVTTDLAGADRAFTLAAAHLAFGCQAPRDRADHLSLLASLRIAQTRFELAIRSLEQARKIARDLGDDELAARFVLKLAKARGEGGDPQQAVELLDSAVGLFDRQRDSKLALYIRHAHACLLLDTGRVADARRELEILEPAWLEFVRSPLDRQRFGWLEAKVSWAEGKKRQAERRLLAVREACEAADADHDFALVSLDLAALYLEQGRTSEVRRLAEELAPLFESRELHRHALAALALFEQAAASKEATAGWVRQLARYLRQSRHNPYLRFQPA